MQNLGKLYTREVHVNVHVQCIHGSLYIDTYIHS